MQSHDNVKKKKVTNSENIIEIVKDEKTFSKRQKYKFW